MNIYYKIWADAILRFRKHHPEKDWKTTLFVHITWMHALNWWILFLWLKYFKIVEIPLIQINFLPGTILDQVLAFTIEFAVPFGILNYFLIFHKDRYQRITENYTPSKHYAFVYTMIIALGAFISGILYGLVLT